MVLLETFDTHEGGTWTPLAEGQHLRGSTTSKLTPMLFANAFVTTPTYPSPVNKNVRNNKVCVKTNSASSNKGEERTCKVVRRDSGFANSAAARQRYHLEKVENVG